MKPLTDLLSENVKCKWNQNCELAFQAIKKVIAREVSLTFLDCNKPFHSCSGASKFQIGAVLSQGGRPIAFHSKKLLESQLNCSVGEKEMLAMVATLHEFKNVLLNYPVTIHADHMNLACDTTFKTSRVMNWRLKIEEFVPLLNWIPGANDPIAVFLSRHPISTVLKEKTQLNLPKKQKKFFF